MMLGYACGDHLMVMTTPSLMLRAMMMSATSEAEVPVRQGEGGTPLGKRTSLARNQGEP